MFNRFIEIQKSMNIQTEIIRNILNAQGNQDHSIQSILETLKILIERINVLEIEVNQLKSSNNVQS
jgi:hypothetical protein